MRAKCLSETSCIEVKLQIQNIIMINIGNSDNIYKNVGNFIIDSGGTKNFKMGGGDQEKFQPFLEPNPEFCYHNLELLWQKEGQKRGEEAMPSL
jgi:hypothetical protein